MSIKGRLDRLEATGARDVLCSCRQSTELRNYRSRAEADADDRPARACEMCGRPKALIFKVVMPAGVMA